jgi:TonB family protein
MRSEEKEKVYYNWFEKRNKFVNRTILKEKGISILASLLFHAAILLLLVKVVPPVQVYLFRQVTDVHIVPPGTMYYPRIENLSEEFQAPGSSSPRVSPENLSIRAAEDSPAGEPNPGIIYLRNLDMGREMERDQKLFNLVPSPKGKGGFSLGIDRERSEPENRDEEENRKVLDLSKYNSAALSSLRFNRITTRRGERIPSARLEQNGLNRQEAYDISPWVKGVVDKIRNNWTLPPIDESIAMGEVKIFILIGKKGDLMSMEIVKSSNFPVFDETTIEAIRASAPFLPMPDDFPYDKLEAYLVFQFNE